MSLNKGVRRALLRRGGTAPTLNFDPALATFTPSMAKRLGPSGVWAAAPIIQGKFDGSGTSDVVSYPRGTQIADYWYENFDPNQGTFSFLITPEWDGDDGLDHFIWGGHTSYVYLYKRSTNLLSFDIIYSAENLRHSVDVSTWTAGTTYCVDVRWDSQNTLDGSNHCCISINDVHSFGDTDPGVPSFIPNAVLYIGALNDDTSSGDSIIEGFHIYRRLLYDGSYGVDVGNGDEVAAHYNGGAFADPSEVVNGSWDCVFALPCDGQVGALA